MRFLIAILICKSSIAQDYVASFTAVPKEPNVINYQVQRSSNNITWVLLTTIQPKKSNDTNRYVYTLPAADNYIRIKTLFNNAVSVYTPSIRIINTNVSITKLAYSNSTSSDKLSFTAANEGAVEYYSIERQNSSSSAWVIAGKLDQTGKKNYTVNISKIGNSRKYRMHIVYRSGLRSTNINF